MWRAGHRPSGVQGWVCRRYETARNSRRVRMGAAGMDMFAGRAPTPEAAELVRQKIKREAPR